MISYALESSREGVNWTPESIFTGKLPLYRAQLALDALPPSLYGRVVRVETGEVKVTGYPASFDFDDVGRELRS